MGFHKRYINDEQIIEIYAVGKTQGVIDWFTRGVDAVITSGELSEKIYELIQDSPDDCSKRISILIEGARQNSLRI
jgi:hypothetical protein